MRTTYWQCRVSIVAWEFPCNQMYAYLNIIYRCKVNAFLPHKRKICIIFAVYDADSNKMMQIKCSSIGQKFFFLTPYDWLFSNNFNRFSILSPFVKQKKQPRTSKLPLQYPGPGSNGHECYLIGFWDRRVYQFRHLGINFNELLRLICECKNNNYFVMANNFFYIFAKNFKPI